MDLNTSYKLYEFREVPDVQPKQGLYAWYLKMQINDASISSPESMIEALSKISEASRYPELEIHLKGHLSLDLRGQMQHLWYGHDAKHSRELLATIRYPEERQLLQKIFSKASPLLTSPLYIGVSNNLNARLHSHKRLIQDLYSSRKSSTTTVNSKTLIKESETLKQDRTFAERIVGRKIDPNHLVVGVIYVENSRVPPGRIRKTIEAAETLLNRMFHPILGRR